LKSPSICHCQGGGDSLFLPISLSVSLSFSLLSRCFYHRELPHASQCVSDTIIISTRVARLNDQSTRRILISYRLFSWCLGRARVWRYTSLTGAPFAQARIVVSIFVSISRSCTVASDNLPFLSPPNPSPLPISSTLLLSFTVESKLPTLLAVILTQP